MCNRNNSTVFKLLLNQFLYNMFSSHINISRSLIQTNNLGSSQNSSTNTNKLFLSRRKVLSPFLNLKVKTSIIISSQ